MESIRVFAPATVANVVCGYDVLGFAVNDPGDEVVMRISRKPEIAIRKITGDGGKLSLDATKNTVSVSVRHFLDAIGGQDVGIDIELHKKMPIGSGLGSSSASAVAGVYAANQLLGNVFPPERLLTFAMKGEELACGTGHADNVAPALFGGFVLIRSYDPLDIIRLPFPSQLYCAIVFPKVEVATREARQLLRSKIALSDAVKQWGNIAGLVSGLFLEDIDLIGRSMQDVVAEPARSILVPDFGRLRDIALALGAVSFGISGSGPSVFSFARDKETAERLTLALQKHLASIGVSSEAYVSDINTRGPKILE